MAAKSKRRAGGVRRKRITRRRAKVQAVQVRHTPARRRVRSNPQRRRSYRRNPGMRSGLSNMLTSSLWIIGGAVGSRMAVQMLLGDKNTGWLGYGAIGAAAVALGMLVGRGLRNPQAGAMVTLGGIVGLVLRLVQDYTPLGQYAQLSGMVRGDSGMGFLAPTTFFVPLAPADGRGASNANMALPSAVTDLVRSRTAAPNGVAGVSRMSRGSRFA